MTSLTVNNQPLEFRLDPQTPLVWALRDAANLTGTKYGCGSGDCGSCTILIDGVAAASCQVTLAQTEGRSVTTIEGLHAAGFGSIVEALIRTQAIQCGFCTPGFAMSIAALLSRNAGPSDDEIRSAIPNICRCGAYPGVTEATRLAGTALRQPGAVNPAKAAAAPAPLPAPTPTNLKEAHP